MLWRNNGAILPEKKRDIGIYNTCLMMVMKGILRSCLTFLPLRCPMAGMIYSKAEGEALTGEPLTVRPRHGVVLYR